MNHPPKVSVCVPTYNRAAYLAQSLESILRQTFTDFELIVVDNASTDETPAAVAGFADARLRYYRNATNIGQISNINRAMALASGEYISICHDDDLYAPDILRREVQVMSDHPGVVLVHTAVWLLSDSGAVRGVHRVSPSDYLVKGREAFLRYLAFSHDIVFSTVMVRRLYYERIGNFNPRYQCADFEMWLKLALHGDIAYLAEPLAVSRIHPSSATSKMTAARWFGEYFEIFDRAVEEGRASIGDLPLLSEGLRARARRHQARRARIEVASCIAAGNYAAASQYIEAAGQMDPSFTGALANAVLRLSTNRVGHVLLSGFRAARRRLKVWSLPGEWAGGLGLPGFPSLTRSAARVHREGMT